ncbi:MAG: bifunctional pantoate--beta-alanine ligase/(d)CMP kinase [Aphanothece sp. CMT-3BRIN-NPC111]|nr:bifunctional pantoate--beta-alanine ligase/(d)CMP kinase [Aphanothece sp. CMT-3BRIN-NPC111]
MRLFTTTAGLRCYLERHRLGKKVGFVPTMGALHAGHLSLLQRARGENDIVIVSIFVNPLQFGPTEDFQQYPRYLAQDQQLCEQAGVDAIFAPTAEEMFPGQPLLARETTGYTQVVPPASMTSILCGRSRTGHFQGVATVVTKLLNLVQPERAYFGQKDAQQLAIIQRLVADLNIPVEIVACPIVREASGLAYSSRNQYLTSEQKEQAQVLYRSLQQAQKVFNLGNRDRAGLVEAVKTQLATVSDIEVEYVELIHPTTLELLDKVDEAGLIAIACRVGSTRLIDNLLLRNRQPIVAIDGPAGAGKSTIARLVAQELGLIYLDSGAMYRAVTWLVLQSGIPVEDEVAIAELVSQCQIQFAEDQPQALRDRQESSKPQISINGHDVTQAIRSLEVTAQVSAIAAQLSVRRELLTQQQHLGKKGGVVAEGRDIGTHVFPDAELKIFLTASVQERARRRQQDFKNQQHEDVSLQQLEQAIAERDAKDSTRAFAPLRKADDAISIQTDGVTIAEVTNQIVTLYNQKLSRSV